MGLLSSAYFFFQCDLPTGLRKIEVLDVWFLHTSSTSKKHTRMQRKSLLLLGLTLGPRKCIETLHMDVSENRGTPKSSILIGLSIINHPFWGTPIFWKHPHQESQNTLLDLFDSLYLGGAACDEQLKIVRYDHFPC